jgi:hypothetical protein
MSMEKIMSMEAPWYLAIPVAMVIGGLIGLVFEPILAVVDAIRDRLECP